jgi:hypothetical protein
MSKKLLHIYLNDHLAAAVGELELARRCISNNEGTPLGQMLEALIREIEQDKATLESLMDHLEAPRNPAKQAAVWVAEKLGRLKLNGQLTGYSDLSRLLELDALKIGIEGKLSLWNSLMQVESSLDLPPTLPLNELADRASRQLQMIEEQRVEAAALALDETV